MIQITGIDRQRAGETLEALQKALKHDDTTTPRKKVASIFGTIQLVMERLESLDEDDDPKRLLRIVKECVAKLDKAVDGCVEIEDCTDEREPLTDVEELHIADLLNALKDAERKPSCPPPTTPSMSSLALPK